MKLLSIILFLFVLLGACTYDNEEDLFGEVSCEDGVSLSEHIQPIIAANCAIAGCHVSGAQLPNLNSRSAIVSWSTNIRNRTKDRNMPPPSSGITLTTNEIQLIDCWVNEGANDN